MVDIQYSDNGIVAQENYIIIFKGIYMFVKTRDSPRHDIRQKVAGGLL